MSLQGGQEETAYHTPALLNESVGGLNICRDGVYVDVTFGGGGHSREILGRLGEEGRLLSFDQDEEAVANISDDRRFTPILRGRGRGRYSGRFGRVFASF